MNKEEIVQRLERVKECIKGHEQHGVPELWDEYSELKTEKKQLKKQLKELPSLEVGKWYKSGVSFMFLTTDNPQDKQKVGYGIDGTGEWTDKYTFWECYRYRYTPATDKEVETALIKEAKKRYKKGDLISFEGHKGNVIGNIYWASGSKCVSVETNNKSRGNENFPLMLKGKWAEIIEEPKTVTLNGKYNRIQLTDILNNQL